MAEGLTPFGKELRKLRIDRNESLKVMADKLGYSPPYLSAIELGKREVTGGVLDRVIEVYNLAGDELIRFARAYDASLKEVCINIEGTSEEQRDLVLIFAEKFRDLTAEEVEKISRILTGEYKDDYLEFRFSDY